MPEYRSYNASNEPDTCLWCGNKLRHRIIYKDMTVGEAKAQGHDLDKRRLALGDNWPISLAVGHEELGGDYVDGFFCGLRCGYMFGEAMAKNGKRFDPKAEEETGS